jgi:hypothetical protein
LSGDALMRANPFPQASMMPLAEAPGELPRIRLLGTQVNKGKEEAGALCSGLLSPLRRP